MKLNSQQFKRFKELQAAIKAGKASESDKAEFAELQAMKNSRGSNDLAWWKNYPELLKDVCNIAFNYIPGTYFPITNPSGGGAQDALRLGVLAKATIRPAIGKCVGDADAFNAQMRRLWLDMHRKYRGIGTYEKADLAMMILSVESVFESIAKFERIYGVINTYHVGNRTVPYALKEALGIGDGLESNLADFRYQLNLRVSKLQQLCLPKGLSVLLSDIVTLSNVFKDSANRRAFMFLFDSDVYGVYDATSLATGGSVKFKKFVTHQSDVTPGGHAAFTLADIVAILDEQMDAVLNDDDIARMCSDLIAAYGPENVMQLSYLPEEYKVEPVQDYERSVQFHNATIVGPVSSIFDDSVVDNTAALAYQTANTPIVIYQKDNKVQCRLGTGENGYVLVSGFNYPEVNHNNRTAKNADLVFDTWVEEPGETEIMCGTRFTSIAETYLTVDATHWRQELATFGTKVVCDVEVYFFNESTHTYSWYKIDGTVYEIAYFRTNITGFLRLTQMDWAPILYVSNSNDVEIFGDIDNITRLDAETLSRIHEVALLSGYSIPMVSRD